MADGPSPSGASATGGAQRRTLLPDARGVERYLRVSWHPDSHQFVVSTWDGEECVGTVRLVADAAAELVALLSEGLSEAPFGSDPARPAAGAA